MVDPILTLSKVHKSFEGLRAVDGVDMNMKSGQITGLIGPNGSGKTTLFNVISGVYAPDSGEIYFNGERIDGLRPYEIYRRGLVRSFQIPRLFHKMTVLDNMVIAGRGQIGDGFFASVSLRDRWIPQESELRHKAVELLEFLDLARLKDDYPSSLSGGQLKLLEIGRALMSDPATLLLDEPAAGVNPILAEMIFDSIRRLRDEKGLTFLVIEHRVELILKYVDWLHVMHKGQIIATGHPSEVSGNEKVVQVYLGEA